ncbi:double-strand break repair helicase AddA [Limimaricola pyoseonensis]|uniref:DNA 3'-5' helicase n=1 Tax=Limimaricola pyoseonensis TaxID=521013 RepID=A0A1G7ELU2_9RHOB|nr:double-strand break repair helicase AddA [Limimaricola pyoseonensis]SDE64355.1 DNA helicase/exodeoxyribonuclease V, subunit A [Limimaricola pyoseonensis]
MIRDAATERQVQAADPANSTWLSANAGSGKTRVLTDRVARLLLDGTDPQNILCLTYTKAAASEMQNRLFRRLGEWAMMEDRALRDALERLGTPQAISLRSARTLFARAIETPGGLRIQTIHSFCAGLLRRFPLEARVSPQFTEMEDRAAQLLRAEVVDAMSEGPERHLVDALALIAPEGDLDPLLAEIAARRESYLAAPDPDAMAQWFDVPRGMTLRDYYEICLDPDELELVAALRRHLRRGGKSDATAADKLDALNLDATPDGDMLGVLENLFLFGASAAAPFAAKIDKFPTKALREADPALTERLNDLMAKIAEGRATRLALAAMERTRTLDAFARVFVPAYETRKLLRGMLDFDDLIAKARQLLTDPAVAQWVLFRLDGGIDHILVDEAQDTSPSQWAVIERLAQEFASGEGAQPERNRTIFVVGDKKQSIYSFQGADPEGFDRMQEHFRTRLEAAGSGLNRLDLEHSFRSSEAILRAVDATFVGPHREGLGQEVPHRAFKDRMPGRVDLWPPVEKPETEEEEVDWTAPVDRIGETDPSVVLARRIADEIVRMKAEETIPVERGHSGVYDRRPVSEGDVLILVQRRSPLFSEIIRACKARGLNVAGADRLKVGGELAVKDIAAFLRFLALPEDDLSLACALRSPLLGWDERALYALAQGRPGHLWPRLRDARERYPETMAVIDDMRRQADFLRPYDLINRLLVRHDGRRRLLARLGPEAEDGIDALLSQALGYEQTEVPGLTGFLEWMETDDLEIKRQAEAAGDRLRVMSVHGAKGLEAPIVFLPDTAKRRVDVREKLYDAGGMPLWAGAKDDMPEPLLDLRDGLIDKQERERRRLLYVAMTRAESWLITCAAGDVGTGGDSWHAMVAEGLRGAGAETAPMPGGDGLRYAHADWACGDLLPGRAAAAALPAAPDYPAVDAWEAATGPLSPSDLGGAKVLPGDAEEGDGEAARARGTLMHLLLEHLPALPPEDREAQGRRLIENAAEAADLDDPETLLEDALRLVAAPGLAEAFRADALAEAGITADLPELGHRRLHGAIDRLLIEEDRVLAIDFKTNRLVPERPEDTPEGILRQMGAYAAMLARLWPGRRVETAVLWTAQARLMPLPGPLITAALSRAALA